MVEHISKEQISHIHAYWHDHEFCDAALRRLPSLSLDRLQGLLAHVAGSGIQEGNVSKAVTALSFMDAAFEMSKPLERNDPAKRSDEDKFWIHLAGAFIALAYKAVEQISQAEQRLAALRILQERAAV